MGKRAGPGLGIAATTLIALMASCTANGGQIASSPGASPAGGITPLVISASPMRVAQKSEAMIFTAKSPSAGDSSVRYRWTASRGLLKTNTGPAVSWTPLEFDHDIEPGTGFIKVLVSDSKGETAQATRSVLINPDGSAIAQ